MKFTKNTTIATIATASAITTLGVTYLIASAKNKKYIKTHKIVLREGLQDIINKFNNYDPDEYCAFFGGADEAIGVLDDDDIDDVMCGEPAYLQMFDNILKNSNVTKTCDMFKKISKMLDSKLSISEKYEKITNYLKSLEKDLKKD